MTTYCLMLLNLSYVCISLSHLACKVSMGNMCFPKKTRKCGAHKCSASIWVSATFYNSGHHIKGEKNHLLEIKQLRSPKSYSYLTYINCGLSADYFVWKWCQFGNILQSNILLLLLITTQKANHNFSLGRYTSPPVHHYANIPLLWAILYSDDWRVLKVLLIATQTILLCSLKTGRSEAAQPWH